MIDRDLETVLRRNVLTRHFPPVRTRDHTNGPREVRGE